MGGSTSDEQVRESDVIRESTRFARACNPGCLTRSWAGTGREWETPSRGVVARLVILASAGPGVHVGEGVDDGSTP